MALSGSVSTNKGTDGRYYKLSWSATQSVSNNTSTISWTLTSEGAGSEWIAEYNLYAKIDGTSVYTNTSRLRRYAGTIKSGTLTLNHNDNGSRSFTIALGAAVYYSTINCTGSATVTLDTIPRKSTLSLTASELGVKHTITIDKKSSSFTHTLKWQSGSYSGTICDKSTATSLNFTPELKLANGAPYGNSVYCGFTLITYSGSTEVGTYAKGVWFTIPNSNDLYPSIDKVSIEEPSGQNHITKYGGYVQGQSKAKITITASGKYSAKIQTYNTLLNGKDEYNGSSVTTGLLSKSGTNTVAVTVTDSRGKNDSVSENFSVISYTKPQIYKLGVQRCDWDGTNYTLNDSGSYVLITYSYGITSLSSKNSKNAKLYYKKQTDSDWTNIGGIIAYSVKDNHRVFAADDDSVYDVKLVVSDAFSSVSSQTSVSPGFSIIHLPQSGKGVTFGGVTPSSKESGFNVYNMPAYFDAGITHKIKVVNTGSCNNLVESGTYYIGTNVTSKPPSGLSGTGSYNGWLTVKTYTDSVGTYCYQDYMTHKGLKYHRLMIASDWGAWISDNYEDVIVDVGRETLGNMTWVYRTWKTGIQECWGTYTVTGIDASKNGEYQGFYYSDVIEVPYPTAIEFASPPVLTVELKSSPDDKSTSTMQFAKEFGSTKDTAKFHIVCHTKGLSSLNTKVMLRAIGNVLF